MWTTLVRNQWYVAAYKHEIGRELFARTILGDPLVFYRSEAGEVVALADCCVHRRYPLSESRLEGDAIVCGYDGFTYDTNGTCVFVPGQARIPRTARVPAYPVVERDSFVWVWIGDPDQADESTIPRAPWLADPRYTTVSGMEPLTARYLLLVDDLLDRWQDIEYHPPCLYLLHSRVAPAGVLPNEDGTDPHGFHVEVVYAITPETAHSTHNFWAVARDFAFDDQEVSDFLRQSDHTVVRDVDALNTLEEVIKSEPDGPRLAVSGRRFQ